MVITGEQMMLMKTMSGVWLAFVGCLTVFSASADEPAALAGTYKYVPEQSADIAKAIEKAVEKMNFIKRPIARGRLSKTNKAYEQIRIELSASEVAITYDTQKPIRLPIGGQTIKWTRDDGEVFAVSGKLENGKLTQTYKAEDGMRVNTFHADANGVLHLDVEVSSPQLPEPVKYALVYAAR